jgi:signal transduction histidine kinase
MTDMFEEKGFTVIKDFGADHAVSMVDRDEMVQAITNLMRNALQALEDVRGGGLELLNGKLTMTVRTRNDGESILIDIEDNGIGVPEENQQRLFEGHFTTKPSDQGTGLGLGISRRFVRGYGGDIVFVSSQPKKSTVFRIRLPFLADHESKGAVA